MNADISKDEALEIREAVICFGNLDDLAICKRTVIEHGFDDVEVLDADYYCCYWVKAKAVTTLDEDTFVKTLATLVEPMKSCGGVQSMSSWMRDEPRVREENESVKRKCEERMKRRAAKIAAPVAPVAPVDADLDDNERQIYRGILRALELKQQAFSTETMHGLYCLLEKNDRVNAVLRCVFATLDATLDARGTIEALDKMGEMLAAGEIQYLDSHMAIENPEGFSADGYQRLLNMVASGERVQEINADGDVVYRRASRKRH